MLTLAGGREGCKRQAEYSMYVSHVKITDLVRKSSGIRASHGKESLTLKAIEQYRPLSITHTSKMGQSQSCSKITFASETRFIKLPIFLLEPIFICQLFGSGCYYNEDIY